MSRPQKLNSIEDIQSIGKSNDVWRHKENIEGFIEKLQENPSDDGSLRNLCKSLIYFGLPSTPFRLNQLKHIDESTFLEAYDDALIDIQHKVINPLDTKGIIEICEKNLTDKIDYSGHGILLIKSPQMTYKTQSIKKWLNTLEPHVRVLLISHRRQLVNQTCEELGLENYQDITEDKTMSSIDKGVALRTTPRLAISWHSLHKVLQTKIGSESLPLPMFDVVLFDESDQVFRDFYTSDLNKHDKSITDMIMRTIVFHSNIVIGLDADMSDATRRTLLDYKGDSLIRIYSNTFPIFTGCEFTFLDEQNRVYDKAKEFIDDGEIVFITTEHKGKDTSTYPCAWTLHNYLKEEGYTGIKIDADNTGRHLVKLITETPNAIVPKLIRGEEVKYNDKVIWKEGKKLQYLITTSILETGWSCGQIGETDSFTKTLGVFPGTPERIYTIHSIRQAIRRARNVKDHYLFVGGEKGIYKNLPEIIEELDTTGKWTHEANLLRNIDWEDAKATTELQSLDFRALFMMKFTEMAKTSRMPHLKHLLESFGGVVHIDTSKAQYEAPKLDKWERINLQNKAIDDVVNALEITSRVRGEIAYNNTEETKLIKAKYDVRKTFDWFGDDKELEERPDIDRTMVRRWKNGDIRDCYKLRQIAEDLIEYRERQDELKETFIDSKHETFKGEILDRFYEALQVDKGEIFDHNKKVIFEWNIPEDTQDYFSNESVIDSLNYILKGFVKKPQAKPNENGLDRDTFKPFSPLHYFAQLGRRLDLDIQYVQPYDDKLKDEIIKSFALSSKENVARWLENKCIEKAKQLGHLKGIYKATPKKEKIKDLLKRNITDSIVLENEDIFHPYGIALLRYRNPHLIVNNFETYPIGIFSELTKYDIRDENYELAYGLNSENGKPIKSSAIPENIWEEFE